MSRSFKKRYYDTFCSSVGDKQYRAFYHHQRRSKIRKQIRDMEKEYNGTGDVTEAEDKVVNKNIDYSLKNADKWSWPSDGGAYYFGSLESLQADFDKDVFGENPYKCYNHYSNIWERYIYTRQKILEKKLNHLYKEDWFDNLFLTYKIPLDLTNSQSLIDWLVPRQREIIENMYKMLTSK